MHESHGLLGIPALGRVRVLGTHLCRRLCCNKGSSDIAHSPPVEEHRVKKKLYICCLNNLLVYSCTWLTFIAIWSHQAYHGYQAVTMTWGPSHGAARCEGWLDLLRGSCQASTRRASNFLSISSCTAFEIHQSTVCASARKIPAPLWIRKRLD